LLTNTELNHGGSYNLVPFTEMFRYKIGSDLFYFNVIGNIAVFVPFGYFISSYIKPKRILPILLVSVISSTTVEFVQLCIGRSFDVDDILLNIVGCVAGYLLYIGLTAIKNHLPKVFQGDGIYNLVCLVIVLLIVLYVLSLRKNGRV